MANRDLDGNVIVDENGQALLVSRFPDNIEERFSVFREAKDREMER